MWIKDGKALAGKSIILNGHRIYNPSTKQLQEAGYVYSKPVPIDKDGNVVEKRSILSRVFSAFRRVK